MPAYDKLEIKSNIKDYSVTLVDDFSKTLVESSLEKSFIVIDQAVFRLYNKRLQGILQKGKYLVIEATEFHKTLDYIEVVIKTLIDNGIKKNNILMAIGGGIIQDITGFVASILFRGIEWSFYPTTLLAQCDSCIGSKTSINVGEFKNQVGTFYPPQQLILDINFLKTLSPTDLKSGLGEIIKVHLLDGESSLRYITSHYTQDSSDLATFREMILRSLRIKRDIIEKDEFDKNYRNILNYGHTFGHAIESITGYKVCHGQAVTVGMDIANYISLRLAMLPQKSYKLMRKALEKNYPEFRLGKEQVEPLLVALSKDKKNIDQDLSLILTKGPGEMLKMKLPMDKSLKGYLKDYGTLVMSR